MPAHPSPQAESKDAVDVLIVGAGPTGLALAVDLVRRGVCTLVVEAADRPFSGSRGLSLQPRTQEVLDDIGVMDALREAGRPLPPMQTWRNGRRDGEWRLVERDPQAPVTRYPVQWLVPQWRTQQILQDRLLALGGVVEYGTRLTALHQTDQLVQAELTQTDGSRRTLNMPYLVGADGGRSTVREALGIKMKTEGGALHAAVVADVRVDGLDHDHWHTWPDGPGGELLLCPLPGTDQFQLTTPVGGEEGDPCPQRIRELIATRTHLSATAVTDVQWTSSYKPRTALAERFRDKRVF
ncbi:FAD-dependent monooxygenase, partial [Streptomyces chryseus]